MDMKLELVPDTDTDSDRAKAFYVDQIGFVEDLVDLAPPPEGDDEADPGAFWKEFIRETSPEFRKPTVDQLETFIAPTFQALIDGVKHCEPHLREIVARQQPDVLVEDNVVIFPALTTSGAPCWAMSGVAKARYAPPGRKSNSWRDR